MDEHHLTETIMFKNGTRLTVKLDRATLDKLFADLRQGQQHGAYDAMSVPTSAPASHSPTSQPTRLILSLTDILYIG